MRRLSLLAVLLASLSPMPARAQLTLDTLLANLRREPPTTESFHDVRYRRALRAPLVSVGTLSWRGGSAFERTVTSPYSEVGRVEGQTLTVTRARGRERIIPLARAPELQVLFGGLAALFAGDADAIERLFTVELDGDARWRLELTPKDEAMRERVSSLELRGDGARARCLILRQPGAEVLTLLDAAQAPEPAPDFASLVERNCPAP